MRHWGHVKKPGWKDQILSSDYREVLQTSPNKPAHLAITSPPHNVRLDRFSATGT